MNWCAEAYRRAGLMALPGVDHIGIVHRSEAIKAIRAAMADTNA